MGSGRGRLPLKGGGCGQGPKTLRAPFCSGLAPQGESFGELTARPRLHPAPPCPQASARGLLPESPPGLHCWLGVPSWGRAEADGGLHLGGRSLLTRRGAEGGAPLLSDPEGCLSSLRAHSSDSRKLVICPWEQELHFQGTGCLKFVFETVTSGHCVCCSSV